MPICGLSAGNPLSDPLLVGRDVAMTVSGKWTIEL